jgi:hypothetical protein
VQIAPDSGGRWQQILQINGRVLPSPEDTQASVILLTVTEAVGS